MGLLDGKVALITGASRGIGAATAERMVEEGAQVVIGDLREEVHETAERLGDAVTGVTYDATKPDTIKALVDAAVSKHGRIDILHNNAAITDQAWSQDRTVADIEIDFWDLTFAVNLRGTFITTKYVLPHMVKQKSGAIISTSSIAAFSAAGSLVAYGTSKAGVVAFTKYLAIQYGRDGIRSNCIAPGATMTENVLNNVPTVADVVMDAIPYTRPGYGRDQAGVVVFLASDLASFVNGQLITVDGGQTSGQVGPFSPEESAAVDPSEAIAG